MTVGELIDQFSEWHRSIQMEVSDVVSLLTQPLPDDPSELIKVLSELESWNARCGYWLSEATSYLEKFRHFYLGKKEDQSETERKVKLDSDVSDYKKVRDQFEVLCDSIKQRLIFGESRLAYERQFNIKPITEKSF